MVLVKEPLEAKESLKVKETGDNGGSEGNHDGAMIFRLR